MEIGIGFADLHGQFKLLLQIVLGHILHARIEHDFQRLRLASAADCQFHFVLAGERDGAAGAEAGVERSGNFYGRLPAQVPSIAVHARCGGKSGDLLYLVGPLRRLLCFFLLPAGEAAHQLAIGVKDLQFNLFLWSLFEVVINNGAHGRIITDGAAALNRIGQMQAQPRSGLIENHLRICGVGVNLP